MNDYPTIQVFTKPACPYCVRAKEVLENAGLPYVQHDVTAAQRRADSSIYASGVSTVPQIFVGDFTNSSSGFGLTVLNTCTSGLNRR